MNWQKLHCFTTTQKATDTGTHTLPLQIDFALSEPELPVKAFDEFARNASQLATSMDHPLPPELEFVRRKLPSFLSQLADLTPRVVSLGSFDGIVILRSNSSTPIQSGNGYQVTDETALGWRTTMHQPILLDSTKRIGTFSFDVVVSRDTQD